MPDTRSGLNASMTTVSQGTYRFRCEGLTHGITIVSSETQGRVQNSINPMYTTEQAFGIECVCVGWDDYNSLMNYVEAYRNSTVASATPVLMRVTVPSYKFDRIGILSSGGAHSDVVADMSFHFSLSFESIINPLEGNAAPGASYFLAAQVYDPDPTNSAADPNFGSYAYPTSTGLSSSVEAAIYGGATVGGDVYTSVENKLLHLPGN